jgi:2-C-methyl-D-erythritol 4-phosphate cytidylyltransferase
LGKIYAVVVAAGKGERMAAKTAKQFILLCGKPLILYSLEIFDSIDAIHEIVLVVAADDISYVYENLLPKYTFKKKVSVIPGGLNRQQSVLNGLNAIPYDAEIVAIHDGARPLITEHIVSKGIDEALYHEAVAVGVPVKDTIKKVDSQGFILSTPKRDELWMVQTPQIFRYKTILAAHKKALADGFIGTDDCILAERSGIRVKMIHGSYRNIKITTSEDLILAQEFIRLSGESL